MERFALVIAQEHSLPAPFAEVDAQAFARAVIAAGLPDRNVCTLIGSGATRTAITSRLRKLSKLPPFETLIVFCSTAGFTEHGAAFLACHDTQDDDRSETSLALQDWLQALEKIPCRRLVLFLDVRGEGVPLQPVEAFFTGRPGRVGFLSHREQEQSHVSGSLKSGIWARHVIEAVSGQAPRALEQGTLTARSLQAYLQRELPGSLRGAFREAPPQTPLCFTVDPTMSVLQLDGLASAADPRLQPLQRGTLRGETIVKVKSLLGFRKYHRVPERANASTRKFVTELAHEELQQDVETIYTSIRESLGYKRREVDSSAERGLGVVRTPDFEYVVAVELVDDDPTSVIWRREIMGIRNPQVVLSRPFQKIFSGLFDTLVFEFAAPFNLESWIDLVEEAVPPEVRLRTSSDGSCCEVQLRGKTTLVRLFRDRIEIQGEKSPGSNGLIEAFLSFQDLFAQRRELQSLPLLPESI